MSEASSQPGAPPLTHLYAPANRRRVLEKAWASRAGAIIVDLEDAVPVAEKDAALLTLFEWLATATPVPGRELWVRINAADDGLRDAAAIATSPNRALVTGVVPAKASAIGCRGLIDWLEFNALPWAVSPLVETAEAVLAVRELAALPRVRRLHLGEHDLAADLSLHPDDSEVELGWHRASVVAASAAAGIQPPVGPVSVEVNDLEALRGSTRRCWRQGFWGRACIHPIQMPIVNEIFVPSSDDVARAVAELSAFESNSDAGDGVFIGSDGRMVDQATVRRLRRMIVIAEQFAK